jgi:hypothetical protein
LVAGTHDRLLIGHNPHHELLAGLLLGQGRATVQIGFRQSGLLALERFSPATASAPYGYWQLLWFIVPPAGRASADALSRPSLHLLNHFSLIPLSWMLYF